MSGRGGGLDRKLDRPRTTLSHLSNSATSAKKKKKKKNLEFTRISNWVEFQISRLPDFACQSQTMPMCHLCSIKREIAKTCPCNYIRRATFLTPLSEHSQGGRRAGSRRRNSLGLSLWNRQEGSQQEWVPRSGIDRKAHNRSGCPEVV